MEKEVSKVPLIKYAWLRILVFLISFTIFIGFATLIAATLMHVDLTDRDNFLSNKYDLLVFSIVNLISLLILVWFFRLKIDQKSFRSLGFDIANRGLDMLWGFILGFLLIFVGFVFLIYTDNIKITSVNFQFSSLIIGLVYFTIAGFTEELMIRGYILNNLMESTNKYLALYISSLIFSLLHGFNSNLSFLGLLNIFFAGFLLGISYIHTKNLWFPTFLHLSWNFFQGPILGFEVSGQETDSIIKQDTIGSDLLTGGKFGFEGSIIAAILIIIGIFTIHFFYSRKTNYHV